MGRSDMSKMEGLFRIDVDTLNAGGFAPDVLNMALHWGILVPVEPCEHGNYAPHVIHGSFTVGATLKWKWCKGVLRCPACNDDGWLHDHEGKVLGMCDVCTSEDTE